MTPPLLENLILVKLKTPLSENLKLVPLQRRLWLVIITIKILLISRLNVKLLIVLSVMSADSTLKINLQRPPLYY